MPRYLALPVLGATLVILGALLFAPIPAGAQGIGLSLTPTVEEARWGEDLLIPSTIFPGALASAHFGRFVSLDAHYFQSRSQDVTGSATPMEARRWGGDIFVALAPTPLAPFLRFGAGVLEFRPDAEGTPASRHLAASLGGGLRIQVRDRLSGELSVRHLSFRVGPGSGVVEDNASGDPTRDVGTYVIGAGLRVPLGGTWDNPQTDQAVRNLRTLALPVRLFGGSMSFADELGLSRHPIMGALLGVDLGPFVGTSLYAFGSARDGLSSPEHLYGYGLETTFNLVRRGAGATPHVILGGGRMHFTEADRVLTGLDSRKKWTATVGAGLDFRVTERFRGEIAARNLVLTQRASADVSSPDELRSNWLASAGLRFVIGGGGRSAGESDSDAQSGGEIETQPGTEGRARPAVEGRARPDAEPVARPDTEPLARPDTVPEAERDEATEGLQPTPPDPVARLREERDRLILEIEVQRLRQALERLTQEGDASSAERLLAEYRGTPVNPPAPRTFELPVLEEGEFRVRFGPESRADSAVTPIVLEAAEDTVPEAAQDTVSEAAQDTGPEAAQDAVPEADDPRVDLLLERFSRLEDRLQEVAEREQARPPVVPGNVQIDLTDTASADVTTASAEPAPRGVLRGEALGFDGGAVLGGGRLESRDQAVLGLEMDVGSALGGALRVRPGLTLGLGGSLMWGVTTDVAWPVPFNMWAVRPGLTVGLGVLREEGITRIMIPNVGVELAHTVSGRLDAFVAYRTQDFFDDQRFVMGVRLRPDPEDSQMRPTVQVVRSDPSTADVDARATPEAAAQEPVASPGADQELATLRATLDLLRDEVVGLRDEVARAEETAREAERRADEAAAERASETPPTAEPSGVPTETTEQPADTLPTPSLVERLEPLERLESVQGVRRVARGVAIVLGGGNTFDVGDATLSPLAFSEIALIAERLLNEDRPISVEGHTDATGSVDLNLRLSEERAAEVMGALVAQGLSQSRVTATGFGQSRPIADNATPEGRAQNRRVEIVVLADGSGTVGILPASTKNRSRDSQQPGRPGSR